MTRLTQAPPPGVVKNATPEATPGRWWDSNNVRWRGNVLEPIGGNQLIANTGVAELPLDLITWHDIFFNRWAAFGTNSKLYAYNFNSQVLYDITPVGVGSISDPTSETGYGFGVYGAGLYGTPRIPAGPPPGIITHIGDWWSMDTFGQNLLVVPTQDGRLFQWLPTAPSTPAAQVSGAPEGNRGVIVTDQRHVVLYGAEGDPRRVSWSDQEDPTTWTPDVTNLAGSLQLQTQAFVMSAIRVPQGVLIFTSNDAHLMSYVGTPYAYGINVVGAGCGPIALRAPVAVGQLVAWPSWQNFWFYNGSVQPLQCDVKDWFFTNLNQRFVSGMVGSANPQFAEIWWDWPDMTGSRNNRYIAFNYAGGNPVWMVGQRMRSAADRAGTMDYPVLGGSGADGTGGALYQHEIGYTDNGAPRAAAGQVYIESGAIVIGEGDRRFDVTRLIFDALSRQDQPSIGFRFLTREQPWDTERDTGLYTTIHGGLMDMRWSARSARMRVEATNDLFWALGRPRLEIGLSGKR